MKSRHTSPHLTSLTIPLLKPLRDLKVMIWPSSGDQFAAVPACFSVGLIYYHLVQLLQLRSSRSGLRPIICDPFADGLGHEPRDKTRSTACSTIERKPLSPAWVDATKDTFNALSGGADSSSSTGSL